MKICFSYKLITENIGKVSSEYFNILTFYEYRSHLIIKKSFTNQWTNDNIITNIFHSFLSLLSTIERKYFVTYVYMNVTAAK